MFRKKFKVSSEKARMQVLSLINSMDQGVLLDFGVEENGSKTGSFRAAAGCHSNVVFDPEEPQALDKFIEQNQITGNCIYGFLTYDTKNLIEKINSGNASAVEFPIYQFFVAEIDFFYSGNELMITSRINDVEEIWIKLSSFNISALTDQNIRAGTVSLISKEEYLSNVRKVLSHIQRGDVYELNYCHEIIISDIQLDPVDVAFRLNQISPNPYSAYYKLHNLHLLCASPEGFLKKKNNQLASTPIKGTAPRSENKNIDEQLKYDLLNSEKERAENVMIVDLVRNDLSKIAKKGTVEVKELFGVYTFNHSHQLISTVSCELKDKTTFFDIIKATFPMGSMTGAPKFKAMQLIDEIENFKRGIFSGSVGVIEPNGDFEFNVVIRSIVYNADKKIASVAAGGAITASSIPENEYNETILKLAPQLKALGIELNQEYKSYLFNNA